MTAYIITTSALTAVGLRHILHGTFGIEAHIAPSVQAVAQSQAAGESDLLFADEATLAANIGFFVPNKAKTVVITASTQRPEAKPHLISQAGTESDFIDSLESIIHSRQAAGAQPEQGKLSARETEVLQLVVAGCINKEIAERLHISINTVLTHRKNITAKLGIKSVSGLSIYAMMNGLIAPK